MSDKSPKSKQRRQNQKKSAKARVATEAKCKQDRQGHVRTAALQAREKESIESAGDAKGWRGRSK